MIRIVYCVPRVFWGHSLRLLIVFFVVFGLVSCKTTSMRNYKFVEAMELLSNPEIYNNIQLCTIGYAYSYGRGRPTHISADREGDSLKAFHLLEPDISIAKYKEQDRLKICGKIVLDPRCFDIPKIEGSSYCAPLFVNIRMSTVKKVGGQNKLAP